MAFTTENRKIENIFQRAAVYYVPRYQRDYVWKEVNWKELWIDLQFTLENDSKIPWSHFLGTIVLSQNKDKNNGLDIYEIIDGQQRLMTIYLLLIALYKNFLKHNKNDNQNIGNYIYESFLTSLKRDSNKELVINNELYNTDLMQLIDDASNGTAGDKSNKLYKPFNYFDTNLKDKDYDYLECFLNKLLSVNIVEIISGEDEEIYNIFEVLNARGQKLRQIELLKNHIMKYIQPRESEFIDKAKTKWRNIQNNVEHLSDPDVLIQHFAKCYIEKNADNQNSIYRLIKEEVKIPDLSTFLDDLEEFSNMYLKITNGESTHVAIKYFDIKRNQQIRSLLCAIFIIFEKGIIDEATKNSAINQLLNFFFLFNTTQQTSNRTDKIISSISYEVYHCKKSNEFKMLYAEFLYELNSFIQNKDLRQMFETNQSFKYSNKDKTLKRNGKLVKFVLERLCAIRQFDTTMESDNLTIEHLLSDDGTLSRSSIENLTLTSEEINSEDLRDKPILNKIDILKNMSSIKENQELDRFYINGKFDLKSRREYMMNLIFNNIFVFKPEVYNITREEIKTYREYEKVILENKDYKLLDELRDSGKNFATRLNNDPKLNESKNRLKEYGLEF